MRCRHKLFDPPGSPVSSRRLLNDPPLSSPAQGHSGPVVVFIVDFYSSQFLLSWLLLGVNGSTWGLISLGLLSGGLLSASPKLGLFYFV